VQLAFREVQGQVKHLRAGQDQLPLVDQVGQDRAAPDDLREHQAHVLVHGRRHQGVAGLSRRARLLHGGGDPGDDRGDVARRLVCNEHRDEKGRDSPGTLFEEDTVIFLKGRKATEARTYNYTDPFRILLRHIEPCVFDGNLRRCEGILDK